MREAIEKETGRRANSIHAGRPVNFEGSDRMRNGVATQRLLEANHHARFVDIHFYPEPVAATLSYLWRERHAEQGIALTVDFGGGTLDLSLVKFADNAFEVLATDGIALGGNRVDQLIYQRLLFPLLGEGEWYARRVDGRMIETPFPFAEFETGLLNWPITHMLNESRTKTIVMEALAAGGPAAVKFERLKDLISYNYSYNCIQAIKIAKAQLSENTETVIDIPELNLHIPFTRAQLDDILADELNNLRNLIDALVASVGLARADITLVIRTGGSSLIVAVKDLLESMFPNRVAAHDPFTSVAGGLAIANYYGYSFEWRRM
jgi:molecular chaperone DnaK (HSP70)